MELNSRQVAQAGEFLAAAEIHLRGGYAVPFAGNMPGIDILASDAQHRRKVGIQVKTKRRGSWHANTARDARQRDEDPTEERFWIFVDLGGERPVFYIAPEWWVQNNIHEEHAAYLARHGGKRARNPDSTHHAIRVARIEQWRDRWDALGIFDAAEGHTL